MPKPRPPLVHGPVVPNAPAVRVTGALAGATVALFADGAPVGTAAADAPGTVLVKPTGPLTPGARVTATQSVPGDGTSDLSPDEIAVIKLPDPLPSPVFDSALSVCMSAIQLAGLVPGAEVRVKVGAALVANVKATTPREVLFLDPAVPLPAGAVLTAEQVVPGVGPSPVVSSVPIGTVPTREARLPPPNVQQPLACGMTELRFFDVVPSADLIVDNEGTTTNWLNVGSAYSGTGAPPLKVGKLVARQQMPRCQREGDSVTVPVGPAPPPGPAEFVSAYCSDLNRVKLKNLVPGATLTFLARVRQLANPSAFADTDLGSTGVSAAVESFPFSASELPTPPAGSEVVLVARMKLCSTVGPDSAPGRPASGGPYPPPTIVGPLFDCAPFVKVTGAHVGSQLQLVEAGGGPLADPTDADDATVFLRPWFPLAKGTAVIVRQRGCNADADVGPEPVRDLPDPLPVPRIVEPVRPHAPTVTVRDCVPGARLYLFVNGQPRPAVEVRDKETVLFNSGTALEDGDQLWAVQVLCARKSSTEGRQTVVKKGTMALSVSPSEAERGKAHSVTVSAKDTDTGTPIIGAAVSLDGTAVGTTGTAFPFAPKAGQPNPVGLVRSPVAYADASFTINLKDPPPKQPGKLFLAIGNPTIVLGALQITSAKWTVVPLWGGPTLTASGTSTAVAIPDPPPGTPALNSRVEVKLECEATASGFINGVAFAGKVVGQVALPNPLGVFWEGKNLAAGWLAFADTVLGADNVYLVVTLKWMGTSPA